MKYTNKCPRCKKKWVTDLEIYCMGCKMEKLKENNICNICNGTGQVSYEDGDHYHKDTCWNCKGEGKKEK